MGKEDVYESDYLENKEIFADLVNGVLYHGEQIVKPQELEEQDGELRSILGDNFKKTIRDKVRLWKDTIFAVFVVENQTRVDYHMVFRVMLSESMAYDKQWKRRKAELEFSGESLSPDEFISGMFKKDKFIPVITIIVYYGTEKPWDGARTLHELLDMEGNRDKIVPFVSNFRLNVFDYHEYEEFEQFHSELQSVFEFLRYWKDGELLREKLNKHGRRYERLSSQAKQLLTKLTKIKELPNVKEEEFQKGEYSMENAFEYVEKRGKAEGIIEMGNEFGLSENKILENLQSKLNISMEEAQKFFSVIEERVI